MSANKKRKNSSLLSLCDNFFMINGEMIEENGEDSYSFFVNDNVGMLGVFDGCGGIGSRKYTEYDNKTGAYIAARVSSGVAMEWYQQLCTGGAELISNNVDALADNLKNRLQAKLGSLDTGAESSILRGSLAKSFPTTASVILFSVSDRKFYSSFIWAGDSRGFVLTPDGLCQVTRDDIEGNGDALMNLSTDSKLTNLVSANDEFVLHTRNIVCDTPAIFITATDGCFGYYPTPMEFEFMLVDSLQHADSVEQWKINLERSIREFTADDYTIGIAICGYKSFKNLRKSFIPRREYLAQNYMSKLALDSDEMKLALWNEYKNTYYRGA